MRALTYAWSRDKQWRSHHLIRHSRKPQVNKQNPKAMNSTALYRRVAIKCHAFCSFCQFKNSIR